jgi:glycosyltransferase involved in cell wall biosynthesis
MAPVSGGPPRLRVLEVSDSRQVWGAELATMALAAPLAQRGIDLTLGSPPGGDLEEHWRRRGLRFVALDLPDRLGLRGADGQRRPGPRQLAQEAAATARAVRIVARAARAFDLVRSDSLWSHLDCAVAGRLARRPVVLELHDLVRPGMGRRMLTAAVRLSHGAVAISQAVADCVGPAGAARVRIVAPAVDLARFEPGPVRGEIRRHLTSDVDAALVGIVGRIDPEKGVDVLVRAMAMLGGQAASAHLVVVGSGGLAPEGYTEQVRTEAERLLGDRVRFVGRTSDVPGTLRALDVLVNASVAEPFGLSVLEAQASGVPVIGTRAGGIPDFVTDGDNGLLVPSGDADSLAKALDRLLTDPDLRARLAARARHSAQARGTDARADVMADLFRRAAATRRRHRGAP